ncbi:MAG: DUF1857 family protein [Pseudobacteriovorax sp.]|nr:DUF1857 family protein [Pseudobacteriovorax sp.]
MSEAHFKRSVATSFENLWKILLDEAEHPDRYNEGILSSKILERFHDGILRSVEVPDAEIREKVIFDYKNKSVKSNLVGHPSLVGVIQKTVRPADEAGASWELESCIEWDSIDDRVDGMIRRNLETFITQSLEKVKKQAESLG